MKSGESYDLSFTRELTELFLYDIWPMYRIWFRKQCLGVTDNLCHLTYHELEEEVWLSPGWPISKSFFGNLRSSACSCFPGWRYVTLSACQEACVSLVLLPKEVRTQGFGSTWVCCSFAGKQVCHCTTVLQYFNIFVFWIGKGYSRS